MNRSDAPEEERYFGLTPTQLNLAFFAVVGAIALGIAVYFGGLGAVQDFLGGEGSPSATTGVEEVKPTAEASPSALTPEEAANAAVLKLDDMPSGWTKDAPDDDASDGEDDFEFTGECAILNEDTFPGELASAESDDFEGPESQGASSSASVFSDEAVAQEGFEALDSAFALCTDQFAAAFQQALLGEWEQRGYESTQVDISIQELAFPDLGDESTAYRLAGSMSLEGAPFEFTIDFVIMRAGRMAGGFTYMSFFTVNSLEEELLAETAAEKMAEANASLAE